MTFALVTCHIILAIQSMSHAKHMVEIIVIRPKLRTIAIF